MVEPRLSVRGVQRLFAGGAGGRPVDLEVHPAQVHALVGLDGAGKTTLMGLFRGMLRLDTGTVQPSSSRTTRT